MPSSKLNLLNPESYSGGAICFILIFTGDVGYSSGTDSKVERAAIKVPDLEADLKKKMAEKEKIDNALRSLRSNQREILKMVYFDGISQNRVAQILHKTPNTIRNVVNHAIDCIIL